MHTQNVKTAAPESSERWVKSSCLRTDNFIRNLHSSNALDVIRADVVLARMEEQANRGCGLHYEIYESRLLGAAMRYLEKLPVKDRPVFMGAAARRGHVLTLADEQHAHDECDELMAELARDY